MTKISNITTIIMEYLMGLLMLSLILLTFMQVVLRYVFNNPTSWSSEISRFILIWMTFTGASIVTKRCTHLSMGFTIHRFINRFHGSIIKILVNTIITVSIFILAYYSAIVTIGAGHRVAAMTRIPMYFPWAALPINAVIMGIFLIEHIVNEVNVLLRRT